LLSQSLTTKGARTFCLRFLFAIVSLSVSSASQT
jgi:hypothetical protein